MSEAKFTKGPWVWELNKRSKSVELCGIGIEVLRFERYGMQGAAPTFTRQDEVFKLQGEKACNLGVDVKGREHHSDWFQTIDHPDAHLIAAAPEMYAFIKKCSLAFADDYPSLRDSANELLAQARGEHE